MNNSYIYIKDDMFFSHYSSIDELCKYVSTLLPVEKIKDKNSIKYLFNSSKIKVNNSIYMGEYTSKVTGIVRKLSEGLNEGIKEPAESTEKIELVFTINDETYNVDVYKNYFIYLGDYYSSPGIFNIIINIVAAG